MVRQMEFSPSKLEAPEIEKLKLLVPTEDQGVLDLRLRGYHYTGAFPRVLPVELGPDNPHSGRYLITTQALTDNVYKVDEHGCMLARWCAAPTPFMADDTGRLQNVMTASERWFGQYLTLRYNPNAFFAVAIGGFSTSGGCRL